MPLAPGDAAPNFELMNQDKAVIKLRDQRGRKVVLLFYRMAFSPVCTTEHCAFGPRLDDITGGAGGNAAVVFGVSCDSPFCHAAFKKHYHIPYDLLADPTRRMVKAYDMWAGEEPYNAAKRGTVVVNADGRIAVWDAVEPRAARSVDALAAQVAQA